MKRLRSPTITAEMAAHIRYLCEVVGLFQHQAASLMKVNQGRVCEVLKGHRHPGVPAKQGPFPI